MTTEQKIIRAKVGLLELAKQLDNVSQACKMMGYSRDSFYRFKELCRTRCQRSVLEGDRGAGANLHATTINVISRGAMAHCPSKIDFRARHGHCREPDRRTRN